VSAFPSPPRLRSSSLVAVRGSLNGCRSIADTGIWLWDAAALGNCLHAPKCVPAVGLVDGGRRVQLTLDVRRAHGAGTSGRRRR
jgi:hypothetical protein